MHAGSRVLPSDSSASRQLKSMMVGASSGRAPRTVQVMVAPLFKISMFSLPASGNLVVWVTTAMTSQAAAHDLRAYIRDIPDFPKPGILFKDITPLLSSPAAFGQAIHQLCDQ